MDGNETFNDLFLMYLKMLLHQGFADNNFSFYLGHVSAKYIAQVSLRFMFDSCLKTSQKISHHNKCVCYIGKNGNSIFHFKKGSHQYKGVGIDQKISWCGIQKPNRNIPTK